MTDADTSIFKDKSILFVDDEYVTRYAMERMLKIRFKYVWLAENGRDGLELFVKYQPDIVVTDIEMPIMNGLILLEEIKKIDQNKPVIIMTAFADEAHKAQSAEAILIKPINREDFFGEMIRLFQK